MPKGRQCAALPFKEVDGETWVLLITSRDTGRWILPKGWTEKNLTEPALAAKEAFEEAGIRGEVSPTPVFRYHYTKRLPGAALECAVRVFPLRVAELLDDWPEVHQRRREWFTLGQAALYIDDTELMAMFLGLAATRSLSVLRSPQTA